MFIDTYVFTPAILENILFCLTKAVPCLHKQTAGLCRETVLFREGSPAAWIYARKYRTPASNSLMFCSPVILTATCSPRRSAWHILPSTLPSGLKMPSIPA